MSFLAIAALLVGLFVVLPLVAHLLRRDRTREEEFPAAALVPEQPSTSRQRSRLEDRLLLTLRALMILALALLGATPLTRCSRLSLARQAGGSVALALILDDSQSMQAKLANGKSRWEMAIAGAKELVASARSGDAIAIIRGSSSARVVLAPTTDLGSVRKMLSELQVTDEGTNLSDAVKNAELVLKSLPHADKRIVLLSDLASDALTAQQFPIWTPLAALSEPVNDCAITSADRIGESVLAKLACSSPTAARGRNVEVVVEKRAERGQGSKEGEGAATPKADPGSIVDTKPLEAQAGVQSIQLAVKHGAEAYAVRLSGADANAADDQAPVSERAAAFSIAVVADRVKASVITGGPTVIEQALTAVQSELHIQPLTDVPEENKQLAPFAALIVDDPPGLSPEARSAVEQWLEHGGVALGLLGPSSRTVQLASSLEPFAKGGRWEESGVPLGVDPKTTTWLGDISGGLAELSRTGRMRLDGAEFPSTEVLSRWQDGLPFIQSRALGTGLILTVGLPASVDESDLAIRPLFLAILSYVIEQAEARRGPSQSVAGATWSFPREGKVEVEGPSGSLTLTNDSNAIELDPEASSHRPPPGQRVVVEQRGRYRVSVAGEMETRVVTLDPEEILRTPSTPPGDSGSRALGQGETRVDISSEVALFVLGLMAAEMLVRVLGPWVQARRARG